MFPLLEISEIAGYTGTSKHTIQWIVHCYYKKTGQAYNKHKRVDRPRRIQIDDVNYFHACVTRHRDTYLDELQEGVRYTSNVNPSLSTIWRTLHRTGNTYKKQQKLLQSKMSIFTNSNKSSRYRLGYLYLLQQKRS
ncbi:uncharacterized protein EDB91DRAFT_809926 [Suillus paluster]|uniref:uncharacterized protein n=1 Tax=Suillus paluster TaxID=48578 RepID=UPI001B86F29D|nr:uncharacterized protein EDB91DRAFT_809926 [Suillus paluster]KAG1729486.1 hypothetical protein EDB91DRAFT_809926 [Suillus paluster]